MKRLILVCILCLCTLLPGFSAVCFSATETDHVSDFVEVLRKNVNVRTAPVTGKVLFPARQGMLLELLETKDGWHKVQFNVDEIAYISADSTLTAVTAFTGIPVSAINAVEHGAFFIEPDKQCSVHMQYRDGKVYIEKTVCHVRPGTGSMRYYLTEMYLGTVTDNMIFCNKRWVFQFNGKNLEDVTEQDFNEDIPNYIIYYSPTRKVFYMEGCELLM